MATMYYYSVKDIVNISSNMEHKNNDPDITKLINDLTEKVTSPSYNKTPIFSNNNTSNTSNKNYNKKRKHNNSNVNIENWESIRKFQTTEIVKSDGIQKDIDSIRMLINKITEKTYEPIIIKLTEKLDSFDENMSNSDDLNKIGIAILNMATSNRFNSKVYAKLCKYLSSKYDFMKHIIDNSLTDFMKLFDNIESADPNEDYDKFCDLNIVNDNRRAMSLFLCNLYEIKFLDFTTINSILSELITRIYNNKTNLLAKMENDEIVETILIMVSNCPIENVKSVVNFQEYVNELSQLNTKENQGISNKTKFKHMDIKSLLNK